MSFSQCLGTTRKLVGDFVPAVSLVRSSTNCRSSGDNLRSISASNSRPTTCRLGVASVAATWSDCAIGTSRPRSRFCVCCRRTWYASLCRAIVAKSLSKSSGVSSVYCPAATRKKKLPRTDWHTSIESNKAAMRPRAARGPCGESPARTAAPTRSPRRRRRDEGVERDRQMCRSRACNHLARSVLCTRPRHGDQRILRRGLKANPRESGRWFKCSVNSDGRHFFSGGNGIRDLGAEDVRVGVGRGGSLTVLARPDKERRFTLARFPKIPLRRL